jgi:hypothetical protein
VLICWSFGDGTDSCASYDAAHPYTGAPVSHIYPNLSSYEVTLTVIHADSCAATSRITVQSSQCSAAIVENSEGYGAEHQFFLAASNSAQKNVVNICWSFGDGADTCQLYAPGITDNARHTYAANGLYKACVTAYFQDGCAATGCKYANYVNCDSTNLVIHGNPTNGKYRQTVVTSGNQAASDTTQRDLIAVKNYMYYYNTHYLVRTSFRYELGEIPASAVVLNAHLYLHAKDTVFNGWHSAGLYHGGNIESSYIPDDGLKIGVPYGDAALDMTSFVQYWVNHPERNFGAVLHTFPEDEEDAVYVLNYYGGLAPDSLQPRLEVCYAVPYQPAPQARAMTAVIKASPAGTASAIEVSLYPNPATDALNIRLQSGQTQAGAIYLYDMQGRLLQVLQQHVQYGKGVNSIHVPVNRTNIHAGIYLVKIQAGTGSYTYKVILK